MSEPLTDFDRELVRCLPRLKNTCKGLARDDWEDLVQQTMVQALRYRETFDGDNMGAWLTVIARNMRNSGWRRGKWTVAYTDELMNNWENEHPVQASQHIALEAKQAVEVLGSLNPLFQEALYDHIMGVSHESAAKARKLNLGTVKSRLYRGREAFVKAHDARSMRRRERLTAEMTKDAA